MKRNKIVLYAILAAGAVILLAGLAFFLYSSAPVRTSEEASIVGEKGIPELCDETNEYIVKAHAVALELRDFKWDEFSAAGLLPPPGGMCALGDRVGEKEQFDASSGCKWVTLPDMLPRPESAGVLVRYCEMSLDMMKKVRSAIPTDNSTQPQWQQLISQLQSNLQGAEHLALSYRNTNGYVIAQIEEGMTKSDEAIKKKYLEKFQGKSQKYLGLLDDLINALQQAEQTASQLAGGQLSSPDDVGAGI